MKKITLTLTLIAAASSLGGCASIVNGTHQQLSLVTTSQQVDAKSGQIFTTALVGANCTLSNNKGSWNINSTPGTVNVHRSYEPLHVQCFKPGFDMANSDSDSSTKPIVFGNIIFGGIIGGAIDMADGAAYDYPSQITVPMKPATTASRKTRHHNRHAQTSPKTTTAKATS